jgi:hypothetical protein
MHDACYSMDIDGGSPWGCRGDGGDAGGGTVRQKRGLGLASRSCRRLPCGVVDGDERRVSDCLGGEANDDDDVQDSRLWVLEEKGAAIRHQKK